MSDDNPDIDEKNNLLDTYLKNLRAKESEPFAYDDFAFNNLFPLTQGNQLFKRKIIDSLVKSIAELKSTPPDVQAVIKHLSPREEVDLRTDEIELVRDALKDFIIDSSLTGNEFPFHEYKNVFAQTKAKLALGLLFDKLVDNDKILQSTRGVLASKEDQIEYIGAALTNKSLLNSNPQFRVIKEIADTFFGQADRDTLKKVEKLATEKEITAKEIYNSLSSIIKSGISTTYTFKTTPYNYAGVFILNMENRLANSTS